MHTAPHPIAHTLDNLDRRQAAARKARPYRVTENGARLSSTQTLRGAQVVVASHIASDVEGRVLVIEGPDGYRCTATNAGLTIRYEEAS